MVSFPNGKINLGLHILQKGADGYHQIETLFYPVQVCDALEIIGVEGASGATFFTSGIPLPGDHSGNLCVKAYDLLRKNFPQIGSVQMHLHKFIPMGAGLGGGSSDGTATLLLLNQLFDLGLAPETLSELSLQLGSDCPFFVYNRPLLAAGRGQIFSSVDLSLKEFEVVMVFPGLHISTAWAFSKVTPKQPEKKLTEILALPPSEWKHSLVNDFEDPISEAYPQISEIRRALYGAGALYAALSGSGSTVFGLFAKGTIPEMKFNGNYQVLTSPCLF